jgi:hypothetical protein
MEEIFCLKPRDIQSSLVLEVSEMKVPYVSAVKSIHFKVFNSSILPYKSITNRRALK